MITKVIQRFCFLGDETLSLCNYLSSLGHPNNWKPCPHTVNLSLNLVTVGYHCANEILDPLYVIFVWDNEY